MDGARQILTEKFAEDAELIGSLRTWLQENAVMVSAVAEGKEEAGAKFRDYFDYKEAFKAIPSHRALALFRGRTEEVLRLALKLPEEIVTGDVSPPTGPNACELKIAARYSIADQGRPGDAWLRETVRWTWQVKVAWQLEAELFTALREQAEQEAIRVFGSRSSYPRNRSGSTLV